MNLENMSCNIIVYDELDEDIKESLSGEFKLQGDDIEQMTHCFILCNDDIPFYLYPFKAVVGDTFNYGYWNSFIGISLSKEYCTNESMPTYYMLARQYIEIFGGPTFGLPNFNNEIVSFRKYDYLKDGVDYIFTHNEKTYKPEYILTISKDNVIIRTTVMYTGFYFRSFDKDGTFTDKPNIDDLYIDVKLRKLARVLN